MTVSNAAWKTREDAEAAAWRYRAHGYDVAVIEYRSERAGSHIILNCTPRS